MLLGTPFHTSDSEAKMGGELTLLLEVLHKIEKAGGQATLSIAAVGGKTKMKLEIGTTPAPPTGSLVSSCMLVTASPCSRTAATMATPSWRGS